MSKAETRKFTRHFDLRMTDIFGVPDEIVGYRSKKLFERASAESSFYWNEAKITIELEEKEKGVRDMKVKVPNGIDHEGKPSFIEANAEFVDGVLTEEDRKKIDELLKKISEENQE